ncbi:Pvc16 family protein [Pedobacter aquatilis]
MEEVKRFLLTPKTLSMDELNALWSRLNVNYLPSMLYSIEILSNG